MVVVRVVQVSVCLVLKLHGVSRLLVNVRGETREQINLSCDGGMTAKSDKYLAVKIVKNVTINQKGSIR